MPNLRRQETANSNKIEQASREMDKTQNTNASSQEESSSMMAEMAQNINDMFYALRKDMKKENHALRQDMAQIWERLEQSQQINHQAHASSGTMPTVQRPPGYRLPNTETNLNYRQPFPQHQREEAYESSPELPTLSSQDCQITTRIQQKKLLNKL